MKLAAALICATVLGLAAPAASADVHGSRGHGWHGHDGRHGQAHHSRKRHRHDQTFVQAEVAVDVVEYREPYLPRGVLYNAPPLPVAYGYWRERGDVISAKY
jgi:hypothetical protein